MEERKDSKIGDGEAEMASTVKKVTKTKFTQKDTEIHAHTPLIHPSKTKSNIIHSVLPFSPSMKKNLHSYSEEFHLSGTFETTSLEKEMEKEEKQNRRKWLTEEGRTTCVQPVRQYVRQRKIR